MLTNYYSCAFLASYPSNLHTHYSIHDSSSTKLGLFSGGSGSIFLLSLGHFSSIVSLPSFWAFLFALHCSALGCEISLLRYSFHDQKSDPYICIYVCTFLPCRYRCIVGLCLFFFTMVSNSSPRLFWEFRNHKSFI